MHKQKFFAPNRLVFQEKSPRESDPLFSKTLEGQMEQLDRTPNNREAIAAIDETMSTVAKGFGMELRPDTSTPGLLKYTFSSIKDQKAIDAGEEREHNDGSKQLTIEIYYRSTPKKVFVTTHESALNDTDRSEMPSMEAALNKLLETPAGIYNQVNAYAKAFGLKAEADQSSEASTSYKLSMPGDSEAIFLFSTSFNDKNQLEFSITKCYLDGHTEYDPNSKGFKPLGLTANIKDLFNNNAKEIEAHTKLFKLCHDLAELKAKYVTLYKEYSEDSDGYDFMRLAPKSTTTYGLKEDTLIMIKYDFSDPSKPSYDVKLGKYEAEESEFASLGKYSSLKEVQEILRKQIAPESLLEEYESKDIDQITSATGLKAEFSVDEADAIIFEFKNDKGETVFHIEKFFKTPNGYPENDDSSIKYRIDFHGKLPNPSPENGMEDLIKKHLDKMKTVSE